MSRLSLGRNGAPRPSLASDAVPALRCGSLPMLGCPEALNSLVQDFDHDICASRSLVKKTDALTSACEKQSSKSFDLNLADGDSTTRHLSIMHFGLHS